MEKDYSVCFTGHRIIPKNDENALLSNLFSTVMQLYLRGYRNFICGGAVGFDTMAAECVIAMKERFSDITLSLYLPCRNQTDKWGNLDTVMQYKKIMEKADNIEYLSPFYTQTCMHERNRKMVDDSSVCVAYKTNEKGGTAYTVTYANSKNIEVINLGG